MIPIKQSTALDILFFLHDANGDAVTGKVDANFTKNISKNGAAFGAMTITITERTGGWYHMQLSTAHTDTLGVLTVYLTVAGAKQVNMQYRVHVRIPDDHSFPNVSGRGVDVDATGGVEITANQNVNVNQWLAVAPNALIAGRVDANTQAMAAGVITASVIATGAIDADAITADAVTELRSLISGTADSGTTTTLVDTALTEADTDYWKGCWVLFTSGTIANQVRLITAFNPATDTITFTPATTQAVVTNTYEILPDGAVDLRLWNGTAINNLISGKVDANAQTVGDKTGYSLSNGSIAAATFAAGAIDANAIATDAIGSLELSQAAADKIIATVLSTPANKLATDASGRVTVGSNADKTGYTLTTAEEDAIVDKAWDELRSGHVTAGTFGQGLASIQGNVTGSVDSVTQAVTVGTINAGSINAAAIAAGAIDADSLAADASVEIAGAIWDLATSGHTTVGTFGEQVKTDIDAILLDTNDLSDVSLAELAQGAPSATPTLKQALMLLYMAVRNELRTTSTQLSITNDAGTVICKATLSDNGTTFTRTELVTGP